MSEMIQQLNDSNFREVAGDGLVLIDFWAPWCGPCRMQVPILEELAPLVSGWAKIAKVNVDEAPALASRFGIQSIPTLMIVKFGRLVDSKVGVQSKEVLLSALQQHRQP